MNEPVKSSVGLNLTRVSWEVERDSKISSTMRSDRKDARLSFTSLTHRGKDPDGQVTEKTEAGRRKISLNCFLNVYRHINMIIFNPQTHTDLILLMISTPDCSRRVLVTKLLGTTILEELAFISSRRRLLFFITWGQRASAASTIDSNRVWMGWR